MIAEDRATVLAWHDAALAGGADAAGAVLWRSAAQQRARLAALVDLAELPDDAAVLDVGCGLGALLPLLRDHGWRGRYRGVDLHPELIRRARALHPDDDFAVWDAAAAPPPGEHNTAFISGVFNYALSAPWALLTQVVRHAAAGARRGVAFNFVSDRVPVRQRQMSYHDPSEVAAFCLDEVGPCLRLATAPPDGNVSVWVGRGGWGRP